MLIAAGFQVVSLLPLLLLGIVTTTLMLRLHISRKKNRGAGVREKFTPPIASDSSPEIIRRQAEMYDLAREVQARLDNKIAMLQQLLVAADERIARLSELESERLHVGPHKVVGSSMCSEAANGADPYERETARYAVVFGMADAGHNPMSIARRLTLPLGEVELMLSLRRRLPERPAA